MNELSVVSLWDNIFFITKRIMIPEKYKDFYYLRDLDLHAERLSDCPHGVATNFCEELLAKGLLFKTRDEAECARSVMLEAYFRTSRHN